MGNCKQLGILGLAVLTVSLALMGCQSDAERIRGTNRALSTPTRDVLSAEIGSVEIQDGDCIDSKISEGIDIESVVIVPCSATWQYRALNGFEVTNSDQYPGEDFFVQRAWETCDRRYSTSLVPTEGSWGIGDRGIRCLQESFGLSVTDPTKLDRLIQSNFLDVGECFNEAPESDGLLVELVDCSYEWQSKVINSFEVADFGSYPEEHFFAQRAFESCDRRYTYWLFPLEESWELGNRVVNCLQESFGLSVSDPARLDRLVTNISLSAGECYNEAPETEGSMVEIVSCSDEWQSKVINSFEVADFGSYPEEHFLAQQADEICDSRSTHYLYPIPETWELGHRRVNCLQEQS